MLDAKAREAFKGLRAFTGRTLARAHLTPNALTTLGLALTATAAVFTARGDFFLGGLFLVLGSVLDFCDGAVAFVTRKASTLGAFYDSMSDRFSDALILSAVVWVYIERGEQTTAAVGVAALVFALLTSYIRARAEGLGFDAKVGLLERAERLILLMAGLLLGILVPILWVLAVAGGVTVGHRLWHVYRQARAET